MTAGTSADPVAAIDGALRRAIGVVLGDEHADTDPLVRPSQNPRHGDYQANCAMSLAKQVGMKPRELAGRIVEAAAAELMEVVEPLEVAGPGFINIRLRAEALERALDAMDDTTLGVAQATRPDVVVVDLCGVNVAKQMHVGHLRSTIIGDTLARVFERCGHTVHRENHLGDWGLPIAMVLHELREANADLDALDLTELDRAYRDAQLASRADLRGLGVALTEAGPHRIYELEEQNAGAREVQVAARETLVRLQQGDAGLDRDWHKLIDCTLRAMYQAADVLNVKLGPENNRGESFYRERLPQVVEAFERSGVAREDDGALVVRFEDRERPMLIRKSDGGYLYATTDLAALGYRVRELGANRVIYVVDARQRDHFRDVFEAIHITGWDRTPDGKVAAFTHVPFGAVLGTDRRPLKTRSGENIPLSVLLEEAMERGTQEVCKRAAEPSAPTHGLPGAELAAIGRAVGIGAIKYADLSSDLVRDYVFDMDRMIAFEGATGPYLQYAHARVCSIFARAADAPGDASSAAFRLVEPAEKALALLLLRYPAVVEDVQRTLEPHRLCTWLYDLANAYSSFYQQCPVLKADDDALVRSRLRLCDLVRRTLADGLSLLGIDAPARM